MKGMKKISLIGLSLIMMFGLTSITKADKVCTKHENYYFYLLIDEYSENPANFPGYLTEEGKNVYNGTYFPILTGEGITAGSVKYGRICLSKNGVMDGSTAECTNLTDPWDLEDFYNTRKSINGKGKKITFGDKTVFEYIIKGEEAGKRVDKHYFGHSKWYKSSNGSSDPITPNNAVEGGSGVSVDGIATNELVEMSYLPSSTSITFNLYSDGWATIHRILKRSDIFDSSDNLKVTPHSVLWKSTDTSERLSLLAPALYYVEYETCEDGYSATINYYYFEDNKPTTDRVILDDGTEKEPYYKDGFINGEGDTVPSPTIKNCTIVDENGKRNDADKSVAFTINGGDFKKNVYYSCEPTYNATINYYYFEDNKPTTDRVILDDGTEKEPYTMSGILVGDDPIDVESPEIKGCTIVDAKGNKKDADKIVTVSIDKNNPGDFKRDIYYYCPVGDTAKDSKTGDALIYFAWAVGLGAIGYSVYYFRRLKKEEV